MCMITVSMKYTSPLMFSCCIVDSTINFDVKDTSSVTLSPVVSLQPLNPRQAMVKRLSVINLDNFKRQYARRRWKVKHSWVHCFLIVNHSLVTHLRCSTAVIQNRGSVQPPHKDHEEEQQPPWTGWGKCKVWFADNTLTSPSQEMQPADTVFSLA